MKWINLWIEKFCRLYLHEIVFNLIPQQLFCTKAMNSGSQEKTMILKCLCPHGGCVAP